MIKKSIYLCIFSTFLLSCKEEISEEEMFNIGITTCKTSATFIKNLGYNPNKSAFSTTEKRSKGLVLINFEKNISENSTYTTYQDSTWNKFGYLGAIATDDIGNIYTSTIPLVNTLEVPLDSMNCVYKVDALTGKMQLYIRLPKSNNTSSTVPFCVLGNYFDCHAKKLYVASVAGSTYDKENGVIYVIDTKTNEIIDKLTGIDAMGLFVGGTTGKKMLYIGKARNSEIICIELNKEGKFKSKKQNFVTTLDGLGSRGNDRARKIRYDKYGNLIINGLDFAFNLAAQSDKPETVYKFKYDDVEEKWVFNSVLQ